MTIPITAERDAAFGERELKFTATAGDRTTDVTAKLRIVSDGHLRLTEIGDYGVSSASVAYASGSFRRMQTLAERFWPGPLTLVLPKSDRVPDIVTAGGPTIAIRVPNHPVALDLLRSAKVLPARRRPIRRRVCRPRAPSMFSADSTARST